MCIRDSVEGAATEVEDEDLLFLVLLVEAVGERGGRGLVDDALDVEAGDAAGVDVYKRQAFSISSSRMTE